MGHPGGGPVRSPPVRRLLLAILLIPGLAACDHEAPQGQAAGSAGRATAGHPAADGEVPTPRRVISLVPSVSRIIVALGAWDRLVGRTDFDTIPSLASLPSVGGGLHPSMEVLVSLHPDLVIRFGGASDTDTPARLRELDIAQIAVRPDGVDDVRAIIRQMGEVLDRRAAADSLVADMDGQLDRIRRAAAALPPVRAAFLLGGEPPWVAGPGTFVDQLIRIGGGVNVFSDLDRLYGPVSPEVLRVRDVEVVLVGPGTTPPASLVGDARVGVLPAAVEQPGPDLAEAAWAVARALHPGISR